FHFNALINTDISRPPYIFYFLREINRYLVNQPAHKGFFFHTTWYRYLPPVILKPDCRRLGILIITDPRVWHFQVVLFTVCSKADPTVSDKYFFRLLVVFLTTREFWLDRTIEPDISSLRYRMSIEIVFA